MGGVVCIVECFVGCAIPTCWIPGACCVPGISCLIPCCVSCLSPFCGPSCGPTSTPGCGAVPCAPEPPTCQPAPVHCYSTPYCGPTAACNPSGLTPAEQAALKAAGTTAATTLGKQVLAGLLSPCAPSKSAKTQSNVSGALTSAGTSMVGGTSGSGSSGGGGALPTPLQSAGLAAAPVYNTNTNILKPLTQLENLNGTPESQSATAPQTLAATNLRVGDPTGMPTQAMGASAQPNPYAALYQTMLGGLGTSNPSPGYPVAAEGGSQADILQRFQDQNQRNRSGALMNSGLKLLSGQKAGGAQHEENGEHGEHVPEFITGATGHYVKGKGDGQSDDIPAMLADGEYVFDADTVAALGNGSSDAGAKLLDHFRESLREHKRSAASDKIPPKASPLAYMKEALKRHSKG